jgi:hypothetical protein
MPVLAEKLTEINFLTVEKSAVNIAIFLNNNNNNNNNNNKVQ